MQNHTHFALVEPFLIIQKSGFGRFFLSFPYLISGTIFEIKTS